MRSLLCAFTCLIGIASCATTPYPGDWPRTVAAADSQCPDLTGTYENYGLRDDGDQIVLARIFFPLSPNEPLTKDHELRAVSHLTLDHRNDTDLVIKAWVGHELVMERLLTASQLPCREGHAVYHRTEWYFGGLAPFFPVIAHSSIDHLISLASDGSLVMENHEFSKGAATVIPLAVKAEYWYRFLPTSPGLGNDDTRPRGVHTEMTPAYRLLPPEGGPEPSFFDGYMNTKAYKDAQACLDLATNAKEPLDSQSLALLRGRSTQAFVIQHGRGGTLYPEGTYDGKIWVPATHGLRIEKLHWQPPTVADRYVICLLRKGYRWEDLGE